MLQVVEPRGDLRILYSLEQAKASIIAARTVEDAKDLADRAEALRSWIARRGYGEDIQQDAIALTLWAKRRIGELTARIPTSQGARADLTSYQDDTKLPSKEAVLATANISKVEAARCEQIAAIPEPVFEEELKKAKKQGKRASTNGMLGVARAYQPRTPKPVVAVLPADVSLSVADAAHLPLAAGIADLIVTSPPYGLDVPYKVRDVNEGDWWLFQAPWLVEALRITKPNGRLAVNVPLDTTKGGYRPTYAQAVQSCIEAGWQYRASIVWNEGNVTHSTGRGSVDSPNSPHVIAPVEMVALFGKGEWDRKRQGEASDLTHAEWLEWTNGLWTFPGESRPWEGHPAAFPEELPRRLIKLLSFPGDIVVDPFLGSATTAIVARRLGRKFVGLDISEAYIDSAKRRLAAMGG